MLRPITSATATYRACWRRDHHASPRNLAELQTPALVDAAILEANLARMAEAWPGSGCDPTSRPTSAPSWPATSAGGHPGFTCATIREVEGMVAAGLGQDLLLANEVLDASRLGVWWRPVPG